MEKYNRRRFVKTSIAGAAGAAVFPAGFIEAKPAEQDKKIIYRTLGKTGMKVPVISMGVMIANNPALVRAAMDKGITFYDTANGYQNGRNEEMLGEVFLDYPRNSFMIATKVGPVGVDVNTGKPTKETTAEDFLEKFNISLKRLKMEYVDILYLHKAMSPEMVSFKPIVKVMQQLKKEGKIKFIGVSTHNLPKIVDAVVESGNYDVVLTTYNYLNTQLIRARSEAPVLNMDAAIKKAADAGLGIVGMKALAGGGFLDKERTKPINTTAAIKWVLSNPNIHTVIPGITEFDQLDLDVKMMTNLILTDQEKDWLNATRAMAGLYCTACSNCVPGCKKNLPIPEIMRAYMYAYGYKRPELAYSLLNNVAVRDNPCNKCDVCSATCSKNFNIKEKITDISRLVNVPADFLRS